MQIAADETDGHLPAVINRFDMCVCRLVIKVFTVSIFEPAKFSFTFLNRLLIYQMVDAAGGQLLDKGFREGDGQHPSLDILDRQKRRRAGESGIVLGCKNRGFRDEKIFAVVSSLDVFRVRRIVVNRSSVIVHICCSLLI